MLDVGWLVGVRHNDGFAQIARAHIGNRCGTGRRIREPGKDSDCPGTDANDPSRLPSMHPLRLWRPVPRFNHIFPNVDHGSRETESRLEVGAPEAAMADWPGVSRGFRRMHTGHTWEPPGETAGEGGRPGDYAPAGKAKMPKRRMRTASPKPTLLRSPPLRKPKNNAAPASVPTNSHAAVKYHRGVASGRNMLTARTAVAVVPYASI